jgi:hypothetical protein
MVELQALENLDKALNINPDDKYALQEKQLLTREDGYVTSCSISSIIQKNMFLSVVADIWLHLRCI